MLTSDSGDALLDPLPALPCKMEKPTSVPIEIEPGKTLNIKPSCLHYRKNGGFISCVTRKMLLHGNMRIWREGIHPDLCTYHIYIRDDCKPVRQPQRRMNPALINIVKDELQKLLNANFIFPISNNQWISPLVIVPKRPPLFTLYHHLFNFFPCQSKTSSFQYTRPCVA